MPKVQIWINGNEVWAEDGSNLLEASLAADIHIPHLCHDPRLKPFGSCRMCFVEIEGGRGPVPSCGNVVKEGMKVTTDSVPVLALRKTALELLMTEHCGDCVAPCQLACPAHIDIQGFIAHIANGQRDAAASLIKEQLPFPSVCGRVCPRFCEDACRRNIVDEPVDICALKRYAGDFDLANFNTYAPTPLPDTGKRVAVVGGGPAGLSAAYYLALTGHQVTLYDKGPQLGGMLRYGIPEYRLPKATLDQEITLITDLCQDVRLGEVMGSDFTLESLREEYDAVFLGLGSQSAQMLGLEKEDTPGILNGIGFLRDVVEGHAPDLGRNVVVVGGGNTAMDAARTAVRLGADVVTVVYRRGREEMPANPEEILEAEEEGVQFQLLTNPQSYICGEDHVEGLECMRMELGEPDASGRRRPVAIKDSQFTLPVDTVILAIGQALEREEVESCGLDLTQRGNLQTDATTGLTCFAGVFSAGDCVTGPRTVVEAVGAAKKVALSIDQFLNGREIVPQREDFNCTMGENLEDLNPADFADKEQLPRQHAVHLAPAERKEHFKEFNLGLTPEAALEETNRCMSCGCQDAFNCQLRSLADEFEVDIDRLGTQEKRYSIIENEFVVQDENKCILCGNCVRICQEVQDNGVLGFVNRGFDTTVKPNMGIPLSSTQCESCGQCISACPTGALTAPGLFAKPGPFKDDRVVSTTCTGCSTGCAVELHVAAERITEITSPLRTSINDGNLCNRGRFAAKFVHDADRLTTPLVRDGDELVAANWDKALSVASGIFAKATEWQGPDGTAVLVTPFLSNEENYLAQKFARTVLNTNNISSTQPVPEVSANAYVTYKDVENSDLILVVGTDLTVEFPIIANKVRTAVANGSKLAIMTEQPTRLDKYADYSLLVNPDSTLELLYALHGYAYSNGMLREDASVPYTEEDIKRLVAEIPALARVRATKTIEMLEELVAAQNPVVIFNGETLSSDEQYILNEIVWAAEKTCNGGGLLAMYDGGNARGQLDMGVHPDLLPGRMPVSDEAAAKRFAAVTGQAVPQNAGYDLAEIVDRIARGEILSTLIIGDDIELTPEVIGANTLVVAMATTWRDDLALADVVLPAATYAETTGTIINSEGRLSKLNAALAPLGGKDNLEVLQALAAAMGKPFATQTAAEVLTEAKDVGALTFDDHACCASCCSSQETA
ncbi:MAG: FAD-dependent oxidoreductase [Firmicutes bacterium]|nr:FAD-dependent oxidoreductase [Bacillota bacterium]